MYWVDQLLIKILRQKLNDEIENFLIKELINDWEQYAKFIYNYTDLEQYQNIMNNTLENMSNEEIEEYFNAWISMWLKHYRKRVKIVFNEELYNRQQRQVTELIHRGRNKIGYQQIIDMMNPLMLTLVKHGEIACTKILAEHILLQELGKAKESVIGLNDKLQILNRCMERIRLLACTSGPLIFIKAKNILEGNI